MDNSGFFLVNFTVHSESRLAQPNQVPVQPEATQVRVTNIAAGLFLISSWVSFFNWLMKVRYEFYHCPSLAW